jgi:hypothetical protein
MKAVWLEGGEDRAKKRVFHEQTRRTHIGKSTRAAKRRFRVVWRCGKSSAAGKIGPGAAPNCEY